MKYLILLLLFFVAPAFGAGGTACPAAAPGQVTLGGSGDTRTGAPCTISGRSVQDIVIDEGTAVDWSFAYSMANDSECTWVPTSIPGWATLSQAGRVTGTSVAGSYTVTVTCNNAYGSNLETFALTVNSTSGFGSDWEFRSQHASTIRALNFSTQANIDDYAFGGTPANRGLISGGGIEGGNAMRLLHPGTSGESAPNNWRLPFYEDLRDQNDPGDVTYTQVSYKFPLSRFDPAHNADGYKVAINAGLSKTCQGAEFTMQNVLRRDMYQYYTSCSPGLAVDWPGNAKRQQTALDWHDVTATDNLSEGDRYCLTHGAYPTNGGSNGCVEFQAHEWHTVLFRTEINSQDNVDLDVWIYRYGVDTDWVHLMDNDPVTNWDTDTDDFRALWLLTFTTGQSAPGVDTHQDYTNVIISDSMPPAPSPGYGSDLQVQGDGLSPGSVYNGLAVQPYFTEFDLNWHVSNQLYDVYRQEIHVLGKPQSCNAAGCWKHIVYDIQGDSWSQITAGISSIAAAGHIYGNAAMDSGTGEIYLTVGSNTDNPYRYNPVSRSWSQMGIDMNPGAVSTHGNGVAWHPNLYGTGDGGLIVNHENGNMYWRKATGATAVQNYGSSGDGQNTGVGQYFAFQDKAMLGNTGEYVHVNDGNDGTRGTMTEIGNPPVKICGCSSEGAAYGHLVQHPFDHTKMLLLERPSSSRVWSTRDLENWTLENYTHPFNSIKEWTSVSIPDHGVIFAVGKEGATNMTRLWKPNS